MQVKPTQAASMIARFLRARLVPMIVGSPGIGKSSIAQQVAKDFGLKLIDVRLAQCEPTDLCGFPRITGNRAGYVPMDTFPLEGDTVPEGYNGWLILFDELTSATPVIQAASYKILLDRMVGNYKLHTNVALMAAGNLESDNAIVQPMSTALQSRLVHLQLEADPTEWVNWASDKGLDHRITSFINFKPSNLYTFTPDHTDKTYASPRTWEFTNRILKVVSEGDKDLLPMLAGTLSEGVAREFLAFCKIHTQIPQIPQIVANPDKAKVPEEPSMLYALTGAIGNNANNDNITPLMEYVDRLPVEFQVVTLREVVRRNKALMGHATIQKWIAKSAGNLF